MVNACRTCLNRDTCDHFGVYDYEAPECSEVTFNLEALLEDPLPPSPTTLSVVAASVDASLDAYDLHELVGGDDDEGELTDDYLMELDEESVQW